MKLSALAAQYLSNNFGGWVHAKAQNLTLQLKEVYDKALRSYDLLAMPTTPYPAQKFPAPGSTVTQSLISALFHLDNVCPFNITHHPALNVPCGMIDGRPAGLMLIGPHWGEELIYKASFAFENSINWKEI